MGMPVNSFWVLSSEYTRLQTLSSCHIAGMLSALLMIWQNWAQTSKQSVAKVQSKVALVRFPGLEMSKRPVEL